MRLSPIADFTFLKDVSRVRAGLRRLRMTRVRPLTAGWSLALAAVLLVLRVAPGVGLDPLRSAPAVPDLAHAALRDPLPSGRGCRGGPAGAIAEEVASDARSHSRSGLGPRSCDPRQPERSAERLGDAGALQPDRDHRRRPGRREPDRQHRRLAAAGLHARVHARRASGPLRRMDRRPAPRVRPQPGALPEPGAAAVGDRGHGDVRGERGRPGAAGSTPATSGRSSPAPRRAAAVRAAGSRRRRARRASRRERAVRLRRPVSSLPRRHLRRAGAAPASPTRPAGACRTWDSRRTGNCSASRWARCGPTSRRWPRDQRAAATSRRVSGSPITASRSRARGSARTAGCITRSSIPTAFPR